MSLRHYAECINQFGSKFLLIISSLAPRKKQDEKSFSSCTRQQHVHNAFAVCCHTARRLPIFPSLFIASDFCAASRLAVSELCSVSLRENRCFSLLLFDELFFRLPFAIFIYWKHETSRNDVLIANLKCH